MKNIFKALGKALFEEVDDDELEDTKELARKVEVKPKERFIEKEDNVDFNISDNDIKKDLESRFSNSEIDSNFNEINYSDRDINFNKVDDKEKEEEKEIKEEVKDNFVFETDDFVDDYVETTTYSRTTTNKELYQGKKETSYIESVNQSIAYNSTRNYYDSKDTRDKKSFKPSPIISPIYGVINSGEDKEVIKKEIRVTSFERRNNADLDSVRNKAMGFDKKEEEVKDKVSENKFYDVNNSKPVIDKVTISDADEYYNNLGLAYNIDYKESAKEMPTRSSRYHDEKSNDNLFDLIESMYDKED